MDIVVGSDIANRNRIETEGLIGLLVNTLVLRSDLSGNPRFCDLLAQVRETVLGALAHQDLPFEKLVEVLNPDRHLSQMMPLFQAKLDLQQARVRPLELAGITLERYPWSTRAPNTNCALTCRMPSRTFPARWSTAPTCSTPAPLPTWLSIFRCCWRALWPTRPAAWLSYPWSVTPNATRS